VPDRRDGPAQADLRQWKHTYLGYFAAERWSDDGTEAINGIIELHRRIARGFRNRDNYRLRMLLVAGGLDLTPLSKAR
jgi:transposase